VGESTFKHFCGSLGSFSDSDVFPFLWVADRESGCVCRLQSQFRLCLGL